MSDIARVQRELGTEVLETINIIGPGETPEAADVDRAVRGLNHVHERLRARRELRWGWSDMPEAMKLPYILAAAAMVGPMFGRETQMGFDQAMSMVYAANAVPQPDETVVRAEYF